MNIEKRNTNQLLFAAQQKADQTAAFHCTMYLLPLNHVSKNQLSTNHNLLKARANSRKVRWICIIQLDMYRFA